MPGGIIAPGLLAWLILPGDLMVLLSCMMVLAGFMAWRILIFKIGVYEPIMSMNPFHNG